MRRRFLTVFLSLLTVSLIWTPLLRADIIHVGTDTSTSDAWRTSAVLKPLDLNGDNIYGSDGYFANPFATPLNPPTFADVTYLGTLTQASVFFAEIDDVNTAPNNTAGGNFFYETVGAGVENDFFQITLTNNASFRMAIINDIGSEFGYSNESAVQVRIRQTVGGSADTGLIDVSGSINDVIDYYLFDISGVAGDTFVVSGVNDLAGTRNALAGLTFDVQAVPEPSSCILAAMGLVPLSRAIRRRRRASPAVTAPERPLISDV